MMSANKGTMSWQEVKQGQDHLHHVGWQAETVVTLLEIANCAKKKLDMCIMDSEEKKVNRH
jgi:hypothetical protein